MIKENQITICGHGSGTPSLKNMAAYLSTRYNSKMSNGKRKGVIAVRRLKAMTDEKRQEFHDTYKTILGRNQYNQARREYVYNKYVNGRYYSDCSSSGMATMQKIGFKTGGLLNTVGIKNSSLFDVVPVIIWDGHITNPEILKVGDCILFAGNIDRPSQQYCGHVEYVYEIDGKVLPDEDKDDSGFQPSPFNPDVPISDGYVGEITASVLNIRDTYSTSGKIVGTFKQGEYVSISSTRNGWGRANKKGWVSLKYVDKIPCLTGTVTVSALNVRKVAKDLNSEIMCVLNKGDEVAITRLNGDGTWGYDQNHKGYVSLKYIRF